MRDLRDFDCLPKRKQNEITVGVHKTPSGLEIGNFHSPRLLTRVQGVIQRNHRRHRRDEKVTLSPNTPLNQRISYLNGIQKANT